MRKRFGLRTGLATLCIFGMMGVGTASALAFADTAAEPTSATAKSAGAVYIVQKHWQTKTVDVLYPEIHGMGSAAAEAKFNQLLKQTSMPSPSNETSNDPKKYSFNAWYKTLFQRGNLVEFMISSYTYTGGAHGMPAQEVVMLDTKTGQVYHISDLFKQGSPYLRRLSDLIRKQDTQHELDAFQSFGGVTKQDGFYVQNDSVVVFFSPYEWTAYALGFPTFRIPFAQLSDVLNTSGPFWQAFHTAKAVTEEKLQQAHENKIKSLGYTVIETNVAQAADGDGNTLYAYDATPKNVKDDSVEKVFFFIGTRYLGTDTLRNHFPIMNINPANKATISITYNDDNGKPFSIGYRWNGTRLVPDKSFPSTYQFS